MTQQWDAKSTVSGTAEGEERRAPSQKEGPSDGSRSLPGFPGETEPTRPIAAVRSAKIKALLIQLILSGNQVEKPSPDGWVLNENDTRPCFWRMLSP